MEQTASQSDSDESSANRVKRFGFLSVVEIENLGHCGGLLILTSKGRPIEFHCTAPVSTNRAQSILYGKTLNNFLFCDQIGVALCEKAKVAMDVVLATQPEFAELSSEISTPVAVIENAKHPQNNLSNTLSGIIKIADRDVRLFQPSGQSDAEQAAAKQTESMILDFIKTVPLTEPFERIELAIKEAHTVTA